MNASTETSEQLSKTSSPSPRRKTSGGRTRRRREQEKSKLISRSLDVAMACWLVAPVLLTAGRLPVTMLVAAVVMTGCMIILPRLLPETNLTFGKPQAITIALGLFYSLSLIPLPMNLVESVRPRVAHAWTQVAMSFGEAAPPFVPLSYSPSSTWSELSKLFLYLATFSVTAWLARARHSKNVLRAVVVSAFACLVGTLFQLVLPPGSAVLGIFPVDFMGSVPTPLLNQNHLGAVFALAVPVALGMSFDARERPARVSWLASSLVLASACLASSSRGAWMSLLVGILLIFLFSFLKREQVDRAPVMKVAAAFGALLTGAVAVMFFYGAFLAELRQQDYSKLALARRAFAVAFDHPILGVGRGGFAAAFAERSEATVRYEYPENIFVQWTSEMGLVVGTLLLAIVGWTLLRGVVRARMHSQLGVIAALTAIFAHDMVDFSMETLGVSVQVAALFGLLLGDLEPRSRDAKKSSAGLMDRWTRSHALSKVQPRLRLFYVACTLVPVFLFPLYRASNVRDLELRARNALQAQDLTTAAQLSFAGMRVHPFQASFPLFASRAVAESDPQKAGRCLNRAMTLAPTWHAPHLEAGFALLRANRRAQSWLEALESDQRLQGSADRLGCSILGQSPVENYDTLLEAAKRQTSFVEKMVHCVGLSTDQSTSIDTWLDAQGSRIAASRLSRGMLQTNNLASAEAYVGRSLRNGLNARNDSCTEIEVLTTNALAVYRAASKRDAERELLRQAREACPDSVALLTDEIWAYARSGDMENARAAVAVLKNNSAGDLHALSEAMLLAGDIEKMHGERSRAISEYESAVQLRPETPLVLRVAADAEALQSDYLKLLTRQTLCSVDPDHALCTQAVR